MEAVAASYAYLLALYLGDGYIAAHRRGVYALRIALDSRYPRIISMCETTIEDVVPDNCVSTRKHPKHNFVEVTAYSKGWPCLFPQHGPGKKHMRRIALQQWQERFAKRHADEMLRGFIHSDGCRSINRVNGGEYPRYMFSNRSDDIRRIFCVACDRLDVHWTQSYKWTISVARAADVRRLDEFIGPKC